MADYLVRRIGREVWFCGNVSASSIGELAVVLREACAAGDGVSDHIKLRLNSWGGEAYAGIAAYETIRQLEVAVHTVIEGCCQSAASDIALAGHHRSITRLSSLRIHRAQHVFDNLRGGLPADGDDYIAEVHHLHARIVDIVVGSSNLSRAQAKELVNRERMLNSTEALVFGLVHEII